LTSYNRHDNLQQVRSEVRLVGFCFSVTETSVTANVWIWQQPFIVDSTWFVQGKKLVIETFSGLGTN
jgi:hypothetical protein